MNKYIVLIGLIMLSACGQNKQQDKEKVAAKAGSNTPETVSFSPAQLSSAGIEVGNPTMQSINNTLVLQGKIDVPPQSIISLSFPLGGYLKSTKLLPGAPVRKGQVLAELEDMQFIQLQQDYLVAKERLVLTQAEYNRQRDLNASKASSDKVMQQARAEMETQRILVKSLAQKLQVIGISPSNLSPDHISRTVSITSPINGYVSKVNVTIGKYTSPADVLFELIDPRDIHLMLHVFEQDLQSISIGQEVMAYTNNNPDEKILAEVILIGKSLDDNRIAAVHCHFKQYRPELVPGMFMNGAVAITEQNALTVPEAAIVRWENKFYVFQEMGQGRFQMLPVIPGICKDGLQQFTAAGVDASTRLVLKNAYAVLMKMKNTEE